MISPRTNQECGCRGDEGGGGTALGRLTGGSSGHFLLLFLIGKIHGEEQWVAVDDWSKEFLISKLREQQIVSEQYVGCVESSTLRPAGVDWRGVPRGASARRWPRTRAAGRRGSREWLVVR
jgi:hypothetical protein